MAGSYQTVFDASQSYYPWAIPGVIGSIFLIVAVVVLVALNRAHKTREAAAFGILWSLGLVVLIGLVALTYNTYNTGQEIMRDGKFSTVEGPVENFRPISPMGKGLEYFSVNGIQFQLSSNSDSVGFNRDSAHGGPIRAGVYVRIEYSHIVGDPLNPTILKLEVRK